MTSPDGAGPPSPVPSGALPDVVYRVKVGSWNEQLRFSLRSLANLPHGRVWIVGACPTWAQNVEHIHTNQRGNKWENSNTNLHAALSNSDISDTFYLFDDDFYVIRPVDEVPAYNRGTVDDMLADYRKQLTNDSNYLRRVREARDTLRAWGYADPLCYEVHVPLTVDKLAMAGVLNRLADTPLKNKGPQYRTFYGNLCDIGGRRIVDPKIADQSQVAVMAEGVVDFVSQERGIIVLDTPFLSSNRGTFVNHVGEWLGRKFPKKSSYEA